MMALAFPGKPRQLRPLPLGVATADVHYALQPLLTLLDLETSFHVRSAEPALQETLADYLVINTNSHLKPCEEADFILCLDATLEEAFTRLKKGDLAQPNVSATVFYRVDAVSSAPKGEGVPLTLSGPGVRNQRSVCVKGLPIEEIHQWTLCRTDYPMGIDIYLISRSGDLIGIPRSVRLAISGGHS
jgi:alpha-D-ribose 1-methylphosphonate 5-triphosphate synthase subunit PhnH